MAVTTPILNLLILDTHNLTTLGITDISQYPIGFTIVSPTVEIIPPSFPVATKVFTPKNVNVFNSNDLNLSCSTDACQVYELPDGYWQVKYSFAPAQNNFVQKNFMRTEVLQKKLGQAFLALDLTKCDQTVKDQDMRKIDEINYYIQTSIAAGNECNPKLALDLYHLADRKLSEFLNVKCYGGSNLSTVWS